MKILSLGEKIKERRRELDMTLKNLAGDRITAGQISLIESGKSNPSMDLLEYLANTLNVSVEYLMETEETQANKICLYYEKLSQINILRDELADAEKHINMSMEYIEKYNLENRRAKYMYLKALIHEKKEEYSLAEELLLSSNVIYMKNENYEEVINILILLGKISLNLNAYNSAYSYFQQAEKVFNEESIFDELLIGEIYFYISLSLYRLGLNDKSLEYVKFVEEKVRLLKNTHDYSTCFMNIANDHFQLGKMQDAIKFMKAGLKLYEMKENNRKYSKIQNDIGFLYSEYGDIDKSFEHLEEARCIRERDEEGLLETLINICYNYIKTKDNDNARKTLDIIKQCLQNINHVDGKDFCNYYLLKYKVEILENKYDEAEKTLVETLSYAEKMGYKRQSVKLAITLGKFLMDIGREQEASKYLNTSIKILYDMDKLSDF